MIGEVIKEQRILKNISREELSQGICTEKYVYLIEKNERNPSAYILDQFSEKLGIDLFEYYQYLNAKNKALVVEYRKNFDRYVQLGDVEKLKKESIKASALDDFKCEPLVYDIIIINLLHKALFEGKTREPIIELKKIFETKELNIDRLTLINGYIVLATCYQLEGRLEESRQVLKDAYEMVRNKTEFSRYNTAVINVMISLNSFFYSDKAYDDLIVYSTRLLEFQEKNNEYNRIYYADFYLAFAYYNKNQLPKSKKHFMRGIHSASLFKNKMDINIITTMRDFNEAAEKLDIDSSYIKAFHKLKD